MPRAKKTSDPRLIALRDREQKEQARFERAYRRLRRAVSVMEASRQRIVRIQRRIGKLQAEHGTDDRLQ